MKEKVFLFLVDKISVPIMSDGIKSGVHCTRIELKLSLLDRIPNKSVFPKPGTPTNNELLDVKMHDNTSSTTFF